MKLIQYDVVSFGWVDSPFFKTTSPKTHVDHSRVVLVPASPRWDDASRRLLQPPQDVNPAVAG